MVSPELGFILVQSRSLGNLYIVTKTGFLKSEKPMQSKW